MQVQHCHLLSTPKLIFLLDVWERLDQILEFFCSQLECFCSLFTVHFAAIFSVAHVVSVLGSLYLRFASNSLFSLKCMPGSSPWIQSEYIEFWIWWGNCEGMALWRCPQLLFLHSSYSQCAVSMGGAGRHVEHPAMYCPWQWLQQCDMGCIIFPELCFTQSTAFGK